MIKISPEIIKHIKSNISELHKVLDIVPNKNKMYTVHYISMYRWGNNAPRFSSNSKEMNLRVQMRDSLIEELLSSIGEYKSEFDIEDVIYTEEQRAKLESLRNPVTKVDTWKELKKVKKEWSESFKLGQKVYYKNAHGIITFLHTQKEDDDLSRYTIRCNDTEYRYVEGTALLPRHQEDLSSIPIDKELDKLSTEKLLKMYKRDRDRNAGRGSKVIKRILQDREHIQKGETKIVITNK